MGDKIAAVRVIHDHFYNVCSKHYTPELYVTVDEQMVSFRGGCPVKVDDPSKKNHCFGIILPRFKRKGSQEGKH